MSQSTFTAPTGINYHCSKDIPIALLSQALCRVSAFIQSLDSNAQLLRYEDWWEHDGLHFERGTVDLRGLFELVESPRALVASMQGDERVFVGIASSDASWYLRFYVSWDDEGSELFGRFDITLPASVSPAFEDEVLGQLELELEQQDAEVYFKSCMR